MDEKNLLKKSKNMIKVTIILTFLLVNMCLFPTSNQNISINDDKKNLQVRNLTTQISTIFTWKSNSSVMNSENSKSLSFDSLVGNLTDFNPIDSTSYTGTDSINVILQPSNDSWSHLRDFENAVTLPSTNLDKMDNPYDTTVFFGRKDATYNITASWEQEIWSFGTLDTNLVLFNYSQFHNFENYIKPWDTYPNTVSGFLSGHDSDDWLYQYSNSIVNPEIFNKYLNKTIYFPIAINKTGWYYLVMWGPADNLLDKPEVATKGDRLAEGSANVNIMTFELMDMYLPSLGSDVVTITSPDKVYERIIRGNDEIYGETLVLMYIYEFSTRQIQNSLAAADYDWAPFIVYINSNSVGEFPNRVVYYHDESWADLTDRNLQIIDPNFSLGEGTKEYKINITSDFTPFLNETVIMNATASSTPIQKENRIGSSIRLSITSNSHGFLIKTPFDTTGSTFIWRAIPSSPLDDATLRTLYNESLIDFLMNGWQFWSAIGLYYPEKTPFTLYFGSLFKPPYLVSGLNNLLLVKEDVKNWINTIDHENSHLSSSLDVEVNTTIDIPVNFTINYPENEPALGQLCNITVALGAMGNPNITIDYFINYNMSFKMMLISGSFNISTSNTINFVIPLQEIDFLLQSLNLSDGLSNILSPLIGGWINELLSEIGVGEYISVENFTLGSHCVGNLVSCDILVHLWPIIKQVVKVYLPSWGTSVCEIIDSLILNETFGLDLILSPQIQGIITGITKVDGLEFVNNGQFEFNETQKSIVLQANRTQDYSQTFIQLQSLLYYLTFHIDWAFEVNFQDLVHSFGQEDLHWELGTFPTLDFAQNPMNDTESLSLDWVEWAQPPSAPVLNMILPNPDNDGIININWSEVIGASIYYIYRNTTQIISISGLSPIASRALSNYQDTVMSNGMYYYVIVAGNATGNSSISNCESVVVAIPPAIPSAPTLDVILPNPDNDGIIGLNWSDVIGATVYYVYRNTSTITSILGLLPISSCALSNYQDILLSNGTYHYAIVAGNATGNSSISNCESVVVAIPSAVPSAAVLNVILPNPDTDGIINLNWTDVSGATTYYIYRNTSHITSINELTPIVSVALSNHQDIILNNGTYHYVIVAGTIAGNSSISNCESVVVAISPSVGGVFSHFVWEENGTLISAGVNNQEFPQLCSDGAGGVILVWMDARRGNSNQDIYAQRVNASGHVLWMANGTPICTAANEQTEPRICSDGNGGAIITWYDERTGDFLWDIYAQRINSTGYIQWVANGTPICTESGGQHWPEICSDGAGGAIITWYDLRGTDYDIYAQRINSSGAIVWAANGIPICTEGDHQYGKICSDGFGGAIITWTDQRDHPDWNIYAQRISSSGEILWDANGTVVTRQRYAQWHPELCTDGAGGAIIIWEDNNDGANSNIYAQRINSNGTVLWTENGTAVCLALENQWLPAVCNDGNGGAIIVWVDNRNGMWDIYIQKINSSGFIQWTGNGTAVCTERLDQKSPDLCEDGAGGAIITWQDSRTNIYNIYAQWVNASGDFQWAANGTALYPNGQPQTDPQICSDNAGGAFITWADRRSGTDLDIYVQYINQPPNANHPADVNTITSGTESIDWILYDGRGGGKYQVWANDTDGHHYVWEGWAVWYNGTPLQISINCTMPGVFNYTIEYYDNYGQFGTPDMVIVQVRDIEPPRYFNETEYLSSPQNYTAFGHYQFNLTIIDNIALDTVLFEWNGTNHTVITHDGNDYYYDLYDLGASAYPYQWHFNDTVNNWNATPLRSYIINPLTTGLELLLNSTTTNYQIDQSQACNITITLPIPDTVLLYLNASLIDLGYAPLVNISQYTQYGLYNVTAYYPRSQNYTAMRITRWLMVFDTEPPLITHFANPMYLNCTTLEYQHSSVNISVNIRDNREISYAILCENSTGKFVNRTIVNHIGDIYGYILDITSLNYGETLAYYFYTNDTSNLWGMNDNSGNLFKLEVYDFIVPGTCEISYAITYAPNFVLENTSFAILGGNDYGGSGIGYYQYKVDSGEWIAASTFDPSGISNGLHTIYYRAVDNAGNNGIIETGNVYLLANNADYDLDALTNSEEINRYHTDPLDADTDDDGFMDGEEIEAGTDPLNASDNPSVRERTRNIIIIICVTIGIVSTVSIFYVKVLRPRRTKKQLKLEEQMQKEIQDRLSKYKSDWKLFKEQLKLSMKNEQLMNLYDRKGQIMSDLNNLHRIIPDSKLFAKWESTEYFSELLVLKSTYDKAFAEILDKIKNNIQRQEDETLRTLKQLVEEYKHLDFFEVGITLEQHNAIISNYEDKMSKLARQMADFLQNYEIYNFSSLKSEWEANLENLQKQFEELCDQNKRRIVETRTIDLQAVGQKLEAKVQKFKAFFIGNISKFKELIKRLEISEAITLKRQLNQELQNMNSIELDPAEFGEIKIVKFNEIKLKWVDKLNNLQTTLENFEAAIKSEMNLIKVYSRVPELLKITGGHIKFSALASNLNIETTELKEICLLFIEKEKVPWRLGPDLDSIRDPSQPIKI